MRALKPVTLTALLALGLCAQPAAWAQGGVYSFSANRAGFFDQTGPATATNDGWTFGATIFENPQNGVTSATLNYPGAASAVPLTPDPNNPGFDLGYYFNTLPTQAALDSAYPMGTYTVAYNGSSGSGAQNVNFSQNLYPDNTPLYSQSTYSGLQGMNANQAFTASWNAFMATSSQSPIYLTIYNAANPNGSDYFFFEPSSALGDSLTSVTIPAGTLLPGATYYAYLQFSNQIRTRNGGVLDSQQFSLVTENMFTTAPAPEPSQPAALGIGSLGLAGIGLRARRRKADAA